MATKTNTEINGQKYFRIRRTVGHKYENGKKVPILKNFYGSSKGDAEQKYKEYVNAEAEKKYLKQAANDAATLHERANEFIDDSLMPSAKYASGTKNRYAGAYRKHIEGSSIDRMQVKDIRPSDLQSFYNNLNISKATMLTINKFMSALYKWMVRNEYATNIVDAVDIPKKEDTKKHEEIQVWDDSAWNLLTNSNFDFRADFLIKLMSYSGMRIGECLGLKYEDIVDDTIYLVRQYYEGEMKPPKYNSKRDIPMHPKLIDALARHKAWHEEEMIKNGYKTEYVFTTKNGTLYDVHDLRRAFNRFYKRIGLDTKGFHVYRATFCTKLCEAGAPLEVASKILGHKSLEVTAAHYALVRQESKRDAIALLK